MKFRTLFSSALFLVLALSAGASEEFKTKDLEGWIRISPTYSALTVNPVEAHLQGVLHIATEDAYCPAMDIEWGDGSRSSNEGDCQPFDPAKAPYKFRIDDWTKFRAIGTLHFKLTLRKGNRVILVYNEKIVIGSDTEEIR